MYKIPNFFIVGAAKAGTTSLHEYFSQHPQVFMSPYKEPIHYSYNSFYTDEKDYFNLFLGATEKQRVIGEASTNYLAAPETPTWIKREHPDAKILIMLRDPVKRSFSLYKWMCKAGYEYASTFEKALELEKKREADPALLKSPVYYNYQYFKSGLYSEQIKRYIDTFDKEQLKIVIFEEFYKDKEAAFRDLCHFLHIDDQFVPDFKVYNEAKYPVSVPLQYFFRNKLAKFLGQFIGRTGMFDNSIVNLLAGINSNLGKEPPLNKKTAEMLKNAYREDILKTSGILHYTKPLWP